MDPAELEFERPILALERKIQELRQAGAGSPSKPELAKDLRRLESRARKLLEETFAKLDPWQKVQLSRHPRRPYTLDYIDRLVDGFVELHGDRQFADDAAIVAGIGYFDRRPVLVMGHQKGRSTRENMRRNFGMPRPEGYRKTARLMRMAERFGLPVLTFIDTPGAYPGIDAEERGQAVAIAENLELMAGLRVPIVACVTGEGGSGGALALGVADRVLMLGYAIYSVISPEGCASILWKDGARAPQAAGVLRLTAPDVARLGVADEVIPEPLGGAHRDPDLTATRLGAAIRRHLNALRALDPDALVAQRYRRLRGLGAVADG